MGFACIVDVDPDKARKWLLKNKNNRPIDEKKVDLYAKHMKKGTWAMKRPAPIEMDIDGNLINGQHRLLAVLKSGSTIKMKIIIM